MDDLANKLLNVRIDDLSQVDQALNGLETLTNPSVTSDISPDFDSLGLPEEQRWIFKKDRDSPEWYDRNVLSLIQYPLRAWRDFAKQELPVFYHVLETPSVSSETERRNTIDLINQRSGCLLEALSLQRSNLELGLQNLDPSDDRQQHMRAISRSIREVHKQVELVNELTILLKDQYANEDIEMGM